MCSICCEEDVIVYHWECEHFFCMNCWQQHALASIEKKKQIGCMTCSSKFRMETVERILGDTFRLAFNKYHEFQMNSLFHVPCPKCKKMCAAGENKSFLCCDTIFCCMCGSTACNGITCKGERDEQIRILSECLGGLDLRPCPSCGIATELCKGCCPKVSCGFCGTDYCFECGWTREQLEHSHLLHDCGQP